jgi:hypothetical protein
MSNKKLYDGTPKKGRGGMERGRDIGGTREGRGREGDVRAGRRREGAGEGLLALELGATIEKECIAPRGG